MRDLSRRLLSRERQNCNAAIGLQEKNKMDDKMDDTMDDTMVAMYMYLASSVSILYKYKKRTRRRHRYWVQDIYQKRKDYGAFYHLMLELELDDVNFKNYFRLITVFVIFRLCIINSRLSSNEFNQALNNFRRFRHVVSDLCHVLRRAAR